MAGVASGGTELTGRSLGLSGCSLQTESWGAEEREGDEEELNEATFKS